MGSVSQSRRNLVAQAHLEELGRCVPHLPTDSTPDHRRSLCPCRRLVSGPGSFKHLIPPRDFVLKLARRPERSEIEALCPRRRCQDLLVVGGACRQRRRRRSAGSILDRRQVGIKDFDLGSEIAIVRVVQRIVDKVPREHADPFRWILSAPRPRERTSRHEAVRGVARIGRGRVERVRNIVESGLVGVRPWRRGRAELVLGRRRLLFPRRRRRRSRGTGLRG